MTRLGTEQAKKLLYQIARKHNTDPRSVIEGPRESEYIQVKQEFCQQIKEQGIKLQVAADILRLDRTTVVYHANPEFRESKKQRRKAKETQHAQDQNGH